jgi:hypothetical protein
MTDDEHLAVEVARFLQHVHDIADLPLGAWAPYLEQELVRLAVLAPSSRSVRARARATVVAIPSRRRGRSRLPASRAWVPSRATGAAAEELN